MKTISVLSRKGGAGKTTVAVSLAVAARQAGLKAVLADTDPLRSAAVVLGGREDARSLIVETSPSKLRGVRDACQRSGCDLLVIDTPPAPERDVTRAIDLSDLCLAVARPSALDLAAISQTVGLISRRRREGLVVLNQCPPARQGEESRPTRAAIETLQLSPIQVAATRLRSRMAYQHAAGESRAVTEWRPASEAARDVLRLLAEVSERLYVSRLAAWERAGPLYAPGAASRGGGGAGMDLAPDGGMLEEPWAAGMLGFAGHSLSGLWSSFADI